MCISRELTNPKLGDFDTELTEEFLEQLLMLPILHYMRAFYTEVIHITKLKHYLKLLVERLEKRSKNANITGVNSTKGML